MSLVEASKLTGVNRQTLRRLELGEQEPFYSTLNKIASGYGVDVEELLREAEPSTPKAKAPSSPPLAEEAASAEERRERELKEVKEEYIKLLHHRRRSLWNTVHRWETAGYELQFAEISSILSALEGLVSIGLFQRREIADPTDVYEAKKGFERELIHKAAQRLREAADPVLEARAKDRAKEKEAQRARREFKVVERSMRRAA
jgi:transcriptional regulator with XRE-family HTH domain